MPFCSRDENGYYQITGRVDDVINVTGHRLGTAEVEDVMVIADRGFTLLSFEICSSWD
jgi:acetyl-CoA synthetase